MQPSTSPSPHRLHLPDHDREGRVLDLGRLLLGLTVVALGAVYLLDTAGTLNADQVIHDWWPSLVVAAGAFTLAEHPPSLLRGTILLAGGVVLLLFTTGVLDENAWDYVWPTLIILAGLVIVARWSGLRIPRGTAEEDVVRATGIFGGPKIVSSAQSFRGASLTAVFGGVTLDLRNAHLSPEGASVNATAAFGGIDILVPKGWNISVRSTPIFGGFDDKTDHSEPPAADAPTLHIDALSAFGGVEVKHGKS